MSGRLHEKHVVGTWKLGNRLGVRLNHLSIRLNSNTTIINSAYPPSVSVIWSVTNDHRICDLVSNQRSPYL
jgi:hypothetical protein